MAVYKVAQDVEADDKLIGPFSFRQFVYLIIVALAAGLAWGLSRIAVPLFILPTPIILFFGALALPLRKDQPMEIYLAAMVSFYLKPRKRLWIPDGIESLIQITAPKVVEVQRTKDLSQTEAARRLGYLADIADTGGWAIRRTTDPFMNTAMNNDAWFAAQQAEDILDNSGGVAQNFGTMIAQSDERRRQEMVARMQQPATPAAPQPVAPAVPMIADPYAALGQQQQPEQQAAQYATPVQPQPVVQQPGVPAVDPATMSVQPQLPVAAPQTPTAFPQQPVLHPEPAIQPRFDPYPTSIRQSVIQPLSEQQQPIVPIPTQPIAQSTPAALAPIENTPPSTSEKELSPDIISLANNSDLSIETIQREADRIKKKAELDDQEVFISLH